MRVLSIVLLFSACGVEVTAPNMVGQADAGANSDAGPATDTGDDPNDDAGSGQVDAGTPPRDAGPHDSGTSEPDAGTPPVDAGPVDPPPPADDHGNHIADGTVVALHSVTAGRINYAGDVDVFRFSTTGHGEYAVYTTGSSDTFCVLYMADGRALFEDDDSGLDHNCEIHEVLAGNTNYAVIVRHFDPEGRGNYQFHVDGPLNIVDPPSQCGNGIVEQDEECDDGNMHGGDGCDADCRLEEQQQPVPAGCNLINGRARTTAYCWQPQRRSEAAAHCASAQMALVTIDDGRDNRVLTQNSNRANPWIGLSDAIEEGVWAWDGRNSPYRNWRGGEPNDWGRRGEDCVQLGGDGAWNDVHCDSWLPFFCEDPH